MTNSSLHQSRYLVSIYSLILLSPSLPPYNINLSPSFPPPCWSQVSCPPVLMPSAFFPPIASQHLSVLFLSEETHKSTQLLVHLCQRRSYGQVVESLLLALSLCGTFSISCCREATASISSYFSCCLFLGCLLPP